MPSGTVWACPLDRQLTCAAVPPMDVMFLESSAGFGTGWESKNWKKLKPHFPARWSQYRCFPSQHCIGLLIDNWIKSEPASAQGYLLLLRGELYLELFLSYLIFGTCVGSELWRCPGCTSIPSVWCQMFTRQRQLCVSPGETLAGASLLYS